MRPHLTQDIYPAANTYFGDPTQEGCFFEVNDVKAAFNEIKGRPASDSDFRLDKFGEVTYQVFFEVAPDGLCYMLGERQG
jgi:hypothetical protein